MEDELDGRTHSDEEEVSEEEVSEEEVSEEEVSEEEVSEEEVSEDEPEPVLVRSSSRLKVEAARSKTSKPTPETKSKPARKAAPPPRVSPASKTPQDHQR